MNNAQGVKKNGEFRELAKSHFRGGIDIEESDKSSAVQV
jgi:hypothetical protein